MITIEQLQAAGYKVFPHHEDVCDRKGYQKLVRGHQLGLDKPQMLYAINVFFWYFAKHFASHQNAKDMKDSVSCEARLYLPEGNTLVGTAGFTLQLHLDEHATIEAIEAFYARAFAALDCVPDLHNND